MVKTLFWTFRSFPRDAMDLLNGSQQHIFFTFAQTSPDSSSSGSSPEWQEQKALWGDIEQHHKHFHAYQSGCCVILYSADKPKRLTRRKIAVQSISFVCRFPLSQHVFLAIDQSWYLGWAERLYQCDFATFRSQVLGAAILCDKSSHLNTPKGSRWIFKTKRLRHNPLCCGDFR